MSGAVQVLLTQARQLPADERQELLVGLIDDLELATLDATLDDGQLSPEFVAKLDRIDASIEAHPEMLVSLEDAEKAFTAELKQ